VRAAIGGHALDSDTLPDAFGALNFMDERRRSIAAYGIMGLFGVRC